MAGRTFSTDIEQSIDQEVKEITTEAYNTCKATLSANRKLMDKLKERLLESETVDASELQKLVFEYSADSTVPMATI